MERRPYAAAHGGTLAGARLTAACPHGPCREEIDRVEFGPFATTPEPPRMDAERQNAISLRIEDLGQRTAELRRYL